MWLGLPLLQCLSSPRRKTPSSTQALIKLAAPDNMFMFVKCVKVSHQIHSIQVRKWSGTKEGEREREFRL